MKTCCAGVARELLGLSSLPGFHVNYSAKANTNLALLRIVREEGCHADAMSPGELHINKLAGFTPDRLLYVCNNVSAEEMKNAADNGLIVSVDSLSQLDQYGKVNPAGKVMIRINPGIGPGITKRSSQPERKPSSASIPPHWMRSAPCSKSTA